MKIKTLMSVLTLAAMAAFSPSVWSAATATDGPDFKIGDPAPAIKPQEWIRGTPVTKYEPGRVYVVEFWATWCPPCVEAIPHLSELQKQHSGDLTVVGVNVDGMGGYNADAGKVRDFVAKKGEKMSYTVAMDDPAKQTVSETWMTAGGSFGIPTAFIIDRQGKLAWVGNVAVPEKYSFDDALKDTLAGKTDLAQARAMQTSASQLSAKYRKDAEQLKPVREAMTKKDYKTAVAEADKIIAREPKYGVQVFMAKLSAMVHVDEQGALAFVRSAAQNTTVLKELGGVDETEFLAFAGSTIGREKGLSKELYQTAIGYLQKAVDAKPESMWHWASLAELQHSQGNREAAIAAQQRAIEEAGKAKDNPASYLETLKSKLAEYRGTVAKT